MSKAKGRIYIAGATSALAAIALSGAALAQETAEQTYDKEAQKASEYGQQTATQYGEEGQQQATEYGQQAEQQATEYGQQAEQQATEYGQQAGEQATEYGQQAEQQATEMGQEASEYGQQTAAGAKMETGMHEKGVKARIGKDEAQQMATSFGVAELDEIEDWKITNSGEELGSIDRLAIDRNTGEIVAVVGLEGVVGVNMKEVAVPLSKLTAAGDETLSTDLTKDELQQERDIDPWDGTFAQVLNTETTQ